MTTERGRENARVPMKTTTRKIAAVRPVLRARVRTSGSEVNRQEARSSRNTSSTAAATKAYRPAQKYTCFAAGSCSHQLGGGARRKAYASRKAPKTRDR